MCPQHGLAGTMNHLSWMGFYFLVSVHHFHQQTHPFDNNFQQEVQGRECLVTFLKVFSLIMDILDASPALSLGYSQSILSQMLLFLLKMLFRVVKVRLFEIIFYNAYYLL